MDHSEFLYGVSSIAIASTLFVAILLCNEISFRLGKIVQSRTDDEVKALTGSVQASILGLLALLLGFTFSMSMQRFDSRSMALIDEANAIGTAMLRVELLPSDQRDLARNLLHQYVEARVSIGELDLTRLSERQVHQAQILQLQKELWELAVTATNEDPRPITTGSFVKALNDVIHSQGKRNALLRAHVPEPILLLLLFVLVASIGIMGYSSGLSGKRISAPLILVSLLITLIVFIIIDLDRPKRGVITVDRGALTDLLDGVNR